MTVAKINDSSNVKGGSQEITYAGDASVQIQSVALRKFA